jgi:hypothetical protein
MDIGRLGNILGRMMSRNTMTLVWDPFLATLELDKRTFSAALENSIGGLSADHAPQLAGFINRGAV